MNPPEQTPDPASALQFDTSEPTNDNASTHALNCISCKQPITTEYYALSDQVICGECRALVQAPPPGNRGFAFAKAALGGLVAGLAGALLWYAIRKGTGYEIGLVAILVGLMVGKTIHRLAGRGGLAYQLLAVALTYGCICANYIPDIATSLIQSFQEHDLEDELKKQLANAESKTIDNNENSDVSVDNESGETSIAESLPQADPREIDAQINNKPSLAMAIIGVLLFAIIVIAISFTMPVAIGFQSPIGLLIFGFALWEAWKFAAHRPLPITGPYQLDASVPPKLSQA